MLMVYYLYKLLKWPSKLSTFSDLGHVVFANVFALFGVQSNSTNHRQVYSFDFQMFFLWFFQFSVTYLTSYAANQTALIPGESSRLKQLLSIICKYFTI